MNKPVFRKPVLNRKKLYYKKSSKMRGMVKIRIPVPERKLKALFEKASKECPTASPVHDVLDLLLQYYLENEFIVSRKMIPVCDDTIGEINRRKRANSYKWEVDYPQETDVWMLMTQYDNRLLRSKLKQDGFTQRYVINLLIDYYLDNEFIIRTKVIRVNRYRTGNPKKDLPIFEDREEEKRFIKENHEDFV